MKWWPGPASERPGGRRSVNVGEPGETTVADDFAAAFDDALRASRLTIEDVRTRLADRGHKVASSTLGYWRRGHRRPERAESLETLREIEAILGLAAGTLVDRIGASRRTGPPVPRTDIDALPDMTPAMREALTALDFDEPLPGHIEESLDVIADIDAERQWTRMLVRARLRAKSDAVTRSTAYCVGEPHESATAVTVAGGARLGRQIVWPDRGVFLAELLLDRPMSVGETAMVEYTFEFPTIAEPDCEFGSYAANRLSDISVWARFDPDVVPRRGWRFEWPVGGTEAVRPVAFDGATSLHHSLRAFGPGLMGVRWEW